MKEYPIALFDVSSFSVDDSVTSSDLIAIQEQYIRPVLTDDLYEDFIANQAKEEYIALKSYCIACAKSWLFFHSFGKRLIFKNFLENSSEGSTLNIDSKKSALAVAVASTSALKRHLIASSYSLYRPASVSRVCGFLLSSDS